MLMCENSKSRISSTLNPGSLGQPPQLRQVRVSTLQGYVKVSEV
jgi:hypothetical protein